MNVRYRVELSQAERGQLTEMLSGGKHAARKLKRAQILLAADGGMSEAVIAAALSTINCMTAMFRLLPYCQQEVCCASQQK